METLNKISSSLEKKYPNKSDRFTGSTNEWIKRHSNVMKGKIGEELMKTYLGADKANEKYEYDLSLDDKNIEVKLSCLNETGLFKWLNIRINDNYTHICLIGIEPENIEAYLVPKGDLLFLKNLAEGERGSGNIKYLGLKPSPPWLDKYRL